MMRSKLITLTVAFGIICSVSAEDSGELAEELLNIMDTQRVLNQMVMQIKKVQEQQLSQMQLTEPQQKEATEFIDKSTNFMLAEMDWEKMKGDYISIYADAFTEQDLTALIEFYKSPVGKKFIEQQPVLVQKSMEVGQKKMLKIIPEIQKMTAEFMEKHKK